MTNAVEIIAAAGSVLAVLVNFGVWYRLGRMEGRWDEFRGELRHDLNGLGIKIRELEKKVA